ncbi:MAG: hypothetical protein ACRDGT_07405 [Candidatus Limnocylindria bacterium]
MSERARGLGLGERLEVEAAIENAFAPLRARRSTVGPTRVRAAVRWGRAEPRPPVRWAAAVSRISELGIAVGMSAFVFAAALASVPGTAPVPVSDGAVVDDMLVQPAPPAIQRWTVRIVVPTANEDMVRMIQWLKQGRQLQLYDDIDSTIPPGTPAQPDEHVVPEAPPEPPLLARMTAPLR